MTTKSSHSPRACESRSTAWPQVSRFGATMTDSKAFGNAPAGNSKNESLLLLTTEISLTAQQAKLSPGEMSELLNTMRSLVQRFSELTLSQDSSLPVIEWWQEDRAKGGTSFSCRLTMKPSLSQLPTAFTLLSQSITDSNSKPEQKTTGWSDCL